MARLTITQVKTELDTIKPIVKELDKIIVRGNGEPSMQERLRNIENYIREDRENRKYYFRLTVGIVLTNIISLVFAAFIWFAKIYPVIVRMQ